MLSSLPMDDITRFAVAHAFLSNFYPSPVTLEGERYPTVEHAYQAAKTRDAAWRRRLRDAHSPFNAKQLGKKAPLRPGWEGMRISTMRQLLEQKFSDAQLARQLLETGDARLIEGNDWGDRFWGAIWERGGWRGENRLGKLLMEQRARIARG